MSDLAYVTLGVTQTVALFTSLCPDVWQVRNHDVNDDFSADLRTAEGVAGTVAISIGLVASAHFRTATPLLYSALTVAAMVGLYEYLLRTQRPNTLTEAATS